jgi:cell wall-associated NlpC family hydrolase
MRRSLLAAALAGAVPAALHAQGAGVEIGRYFQGPDWTTFKVEIDRPLLGPLAIGFYGAHLRASSDTGERLWGGGVDLSLFREHRQGPYVVGGLGGGFAAQSAHDFWGSWSAGAGYQLVPVSFFALGAEARWRELTPGGREGVEISIRLGGLFGGRARATDRPTGPGVARAPAPEGPAEQPDAVPLATAGRLGDAATLGDSVVGTAAAVMGTAYRLGGTTTSGFDCSGLIQYAYGRHGVTLPRTSVEQARVGAEVPRRVEELYPGDILTFSTGGGRVTHVGLYVGDGHFIHSASAGVQLSMLSPDDPYGKWWWARWVGVRRVRKTSER